VHTKIVLNQFFIKIFQERRRYRTMGVNLQILFSMSTIILQIILIMAVVMGFRTIQETVNFAGQEGIVAGVTSRKEHETESKSEVAKYAGEKEKQMRDQYRIPEGEELLFVRQVKLNRNDPITEINIVADKKEK
jgi:hypothetical protein